MLRTTVLTLFLAASKTALSECTDPTDQPPDLCFNYDDLTFDIPATKCRANVVRDIFKKAFNKKKKDTGLNCKGGFQREWKAFLGTVTFDAADQEVHDLCEAALANAAETLESMDWDLPSGINLAEYFEGNGFLNKETGNFQQEISDFIKKGGYNSFLSISENPRENDHYTTTEESYAAGVAINDLYETNLKKKLLNAPSGFATCESNTAMCCWHRDRQYFDNNGSCGFKDCANENPGDNTDLCWTEHDGKIFPYPGDGTEKDLHCHGLSWGNDSDINTDGKWNALFYVSMYDHLYQRGYVESVTNDAKIAGEQPMCGCIEDMNPVARADCQQVNSSVDYKATVESGTLVITPKTETFKMSFDACEGFEFVEDLTPAQYELEKKTENFKTSNNDLAGFVFKQWLEGKITDDHVAHVEEKLVGYRDPSVNNSDKKREEACAAAFADRYPGQSYEEVKVTEEIDIVA